MMFVRVRYEGWKDAACVEPIAVYIPATRSIKPTVLIRLQELHTATRGEGGCVDIEVARGWENMRDSCSLEASANTEQL